MDKEYQVLHKEGHSFIKVTEYGRSDPTYWKANGKEVSIAPGDSKWIMYKGQINKLEIKSPGASRTVGYKLKDKFQGNNFRPYLVINDYHELDDDEQVMYEEDRKEVPESWREVSFKLLDYDSEPVEMPAYVHVKLPANLLYPQEVQHNYPCYINAEDVYNLIDSAIRDKIKEMAGKYIIDDFKNIQTLTVYEVIKILWYEEKTITRNPLSKRLKKIQKQRHSRSIKIFNLVGTYKNDRKDTIQVQPIHGYNYEELKENLAKYIKSFTDQLEPGQRQICKHCKGHGITNNRGEALFQTSNELKEN